MYQCPRVTRYKKITIIGVKIMDCFKGCLDSGFVMSLGITHLGSGSRGNATLITSDDCNVLVDCGFSLRQTEKRLKIADVEPKSVDINTSEAQYFDVKESSDGLISVNDILIAEGHAYEYDGGKKKKFISEIETEKAGKKQDLVDKPAEENQ